MTIMTSIFKKWLSVILAVLMFVSPVATSMAEADDVSPDSVEAEAAQAEVAEEEPAPEPVAPAPEEAKEPAAQESPAQKEPTAQEVPSQASSEQEPASDETAAVSDAPVFVTELTLGSAPNLYYVPYGTLESDLPLPSMLTAVLSDGTTGEVSVVWHCVGNSVDEAGYVARHDDPAVVFDFQPTPVGFSCVSTMLYPVVKIAYEVAADNPAIEIAGTTITIALGETVTTDDIVGEPGYDPSYLILNYGTIQAGKAEILNPVGGGTIMGGVFRGPVDDADGSVLRIRGGEFYSTVGDVDTNHINAYVYISGGTFHGDVMARNLLISGGTFLEGSTVSLWTVGSISGGTFYGTVINHLAIFNGPNGAPEFYGRVENASKPFGQIYGGIFYGELDNSAGGTVTDGASFVRGTVTNRGTINAGKTAFSAEVSIVNEAEGKILGGVFAGPVRNLGAIGGGTYNGAVYNVGAISGGVFNADLSNEGTVGGAEINGALVLNTGVLTSDALLIADGVVTVVTGASVTTDVILGAIDDEDMTSYTVENHGEITGGTAELPYTVDNGDGVISGGVFGGYVTGGKITGGTFNGEVATRSGAIGQGAQVFISGGIFHNNVGERNGALVMISEGTFGARVEARNLTISGGTFGESSSVLLQAMGNISGGTFKGAVTSNFAIEGGTFDGPVTNNGKIFGGTFNGSIANSGEITYISEYTITTDIVSGEKVTRTFDVAQTYLNGPVSNIGEGCIYGPVKYGGGFSCTGGNVYVVAMVVEGGVEKLYQGCEFLLGASVRESLRELDEKQSTLSNWTWADGREIGEDEVFADRLTVYRFARVSLWDIVDGVLQITGDWDDSRMPADGQYTAVHVCADATLSGGAWKVPVVNDGIIAGGTFSGSVTNNAAITGGTFTGEMINNASGTVGGATLSGAIHSLQGSRITGCGFGATASLVQADGYVEVGFVAEGQRYAAEYGAQVLKRLEEIEKRDFCDWYLLGEDGSETAVSSSATFQLKERAYGLRKRATPDIQWPTELTLPYGERLSAAGLPANDPYGSYSWETPNATPAVGTHTFTAIFKPKYPTYFDYSGVSLTREITVTVLANAAVLTVAPGQGKTFGAADPKLTATVTGLRGSDKLNYTLSREPGEQAGTYRIIVTLGDNPNYDVTVVDGSFTIAQKSIPMSVNGTAASQGYTGAPIEPKPEIVVDGVTLVEGRDYILTYLNNTNIGQATIYVDGINNYNARRRINFQIVKGTVTISANSATKTVGEADPALTATVTGAVPSALNYTLKRTPGENAGSYSITVVPGNNPNFTVKTTGGALTILSKPLPDGSVGTIADQVYSGAALEPKPVVTDGGKALTEGVDYTLSYANNVAAGTATVTVTGKGNYSGTQKRTFAIGKASATIAVNSMVKSRGDVDPTLEATVTGVLAQDKLNYALTRALGEELGDYSITVALGNNPNYDITVVPGTLTISPLPSSVTLSASSLTLTAGETGALTTNFHPEGTSAALTYTSSNAAVADVDGDGLVQAHKAGKATITVRTENDKTEACELLVLPVTEEITLGVGQKLTLASPDKTVKSFTFASSDTKIATVNASGQVTAVKAGSATITASAGGVLLGQWQANVMAAPTKAALSKTTATIGVGDKLTLAATLSAGSSSPLTWTSSNAKVAAVDGNGVVTAKAAGSATITVKTFNGKTATCAVTVKKAPTSIKLNITSVTLGSGDSVALTATLSSGSAGTMTYASSDSAVATVKSGKIVVGETGTATITATTHNGLSTSCVVNVVPAPESIALGDLTIGVGQTVTLSPAFPEGTMATVTYTSSSASVATVAANGKLTGKKAGKVTITAKTHNGVTATATVTVVAAPTKVALSAKTATLGVGQTLSLTATVSGTNTAPLTWTSSNANMAAVDGNGVVSAKAAGSATITVKTYNGKSATCAITVKKAPTSVKLSVTSVTLGSGDSAALTATLSSGSAGAVTYASSDPAVATVKSGKIVAGETGTATITATTHNGLSASCTVSVVPAPESIELSDATLTLKVNQTATLSPVLPEGTKATLTYTSSNTGVVTVAANGKLTAKKAGTATITVKTHNGQTATCKVTVK